MSEAQVDSTGAMRLFYLVNGERNEAVLPNRLVAEIVGQLDAARSIRRGGSPSSDAETAWTERPAVRDIRKQGIGSTYSPVTGIDYSFRIISDSLLNVYYTAAGNNYGLTLPVDVIHVLSHHARGLVGAIPRETQVYVEPSTGMLWFEFVQGFNYKAVALVLGLLIGFIILIAVRLSTWRIKKERDELVASRLRMMRIREAERSHLASELHDGPVQDVQRILRSQLATLAREEYRDLLDQDISELENTLRDVAGDLRNICSDLKPPVLVHFGLEKAVESCCRSFQLRNGEIAVSQDLSLGADDLGQETRLALYRILQEALNNIEKHADARSVTVELGERGGEVRLVVTDDGRGFKRHSRLSRLEERGHFGLSGMLQRAESVGGNLHIDSTVKRGTRIIALVPVDLPEGTPLFIDSMV